MQAQLSALGIVCTTLNTGIVHLNATLPHTYKPAVIQTSQSSSVPPNSSTSSFKDSKDRSRNVIMFGIAEGKSVSERSQTVVQELHTAASHDVLFDDAFQLGEPSNVVSLVPSLRNCAFRGIDASSLVVRRNYIMFLI